MQTACLRLMGKKLLVALTMEGKFAGEGLQNIDEDDDMLSAMARELVERNGIGETADSVWKALSAEHNKLFPATASPVDGASAVEMAPSLLASQNTPAALIEEAIGGDSVLIFGQRPESLNRRPRPRPNVPEQASLFGQGRWKLEDIKNGGCPRASSLLAEIVCPKRCPVRPAPTPAAKTSHSLQSGCSLRPA
jgi:hypothetical protein